MKKRYEGVSLIEMLLTMLILTFVMIIAGVVLTTMIRTSIMATSRTSVRTDTEFILELIKRNVRNSQPQDIKVFKVVDRRYNESTNAIESTDANSLGGYDIPILEGDFGTEVQFRPIGSDRWICIGYFENKWVDEEEKKGYILKGSSANLNDPSDCFNSPSASKEIMVLNSSDSNVQSLKVSYYAGYGENKIYLVESTIVPIFWIEGKTGIKPEYVKQVITSTQKLTWNN